MGIDWKGIKTLKEKLWLENKRDFKGFKDVKEFDDKILTMSKQAGILVNPQPNTFYVLIEEVSPHPTIDGQRYNFKEKAELYDYIDAFWKERGVTPVMELEIK